MTKTIIHDFDLPELTTLLESWGEPSYRGRQIWQGIYQNFFTAPHQFTNLPIPLRQRLTTTIKFTALEPITSLASKNGDTQKTLFQLGDGLAIETVLMRYSKRRTLCISTQVGCAMGCVFCATGQMGFKRHLTSGEIVEQVMYYARTLRDQGESLTNIVVMGMGEPFHNYENTMAAIDRLNHPDGYYFGARRFTISTAGLAPSIRRFAAEKRQYNLAVSLHTVEDETRSSIMPINKNYPVDEILDACHDYVTSTGRRVTFEWALIRDVNDTLEQANLLANKLQGLLCHVNAIPLNPTPGYGGHATTKQRAVAFRDLLVGSGIPCSIRLRRGVEIQAGCGQLAVWCSL